MVNLNPDYANEFFKKYFYLVSCCYEATFLMQSNRNVVECGFEKLLVDARTFTAAQHCSHVYVYAPLYCRCKAHASFY